MDSEKVIKRDNDYVLHTYNRNPIALEKIPVQTGRQDLPWCVGRAAA